jgi:hypothetical protein
MSTPEVEHAPGCTEPGVTKHRNDVGRTWCRCRGCGATWEELPTAPRAQMTPVTVAVERMSPYRCGNHPLQPVSWKGTDCPQCARDRIASKKARAAEKKEKANVN